MVVKKALIRNPWSSTRTKGMVMTSVSLTVPDQALTIRQIVDRYVGGRLDAIAKSAVYNEDEEGNVIEIPDFRRMDISEVRDYYDANQELIDNYNAALDERKKKDDEIRRRKLLSQEVEREIERRRKAGEKIPPPPPKE